MGVSHHGMIRSIEENVLQYAGEDVRKKFMDGGENFTDKSNKVIVANWVKCAMDRIDCMVDEDTRIKIMESCGRNCAKVNARVVDRAKARRAKFPDLDSFLEAEQKKPSRGTRLIRKGDVLFQFYTPKSLGMNCYCGLVRKVEGKMSPTYCNCSKGFVQSFWSSVIGKPMEVDLLQSVLTGAEECKFAIHLK